MEIFAKKGEEERQKIPMRLREDPLFFTERRG
jgi:hypothetical protein